MAASLSPYRGPWNEKTARHLLNRAGFGVPHSTVGRLASASMDASVALFVDYERYTDNYKAPDIRTAVSLDELRRSVDSSDPEERRRVQNEVNRFSRRDMETLRHHWLLHLRTTTRPLQEKMVLFWHGHFGVGFPKVRLTWHHHELNETLRKYATGNFRDVIFEVGATPAMLTFLDNNQNRRGAPNENWARELLELFTLGIGNYTERDIKQAARAFSGYTVVNQEFRFLPRQHDDGVKTFMGKQGNFDGRDIINIIFEQPQASRLISKKLWEYFVYTDPEEEIIEGLAQTLRENDFELKPLLRQIFSSEAFYSEHAMGTQIKSPVQFVVGLMDDLMLEEPSVTGTTLAMRALGQVLFSPPNVKGWPGNRAWINTNTLLARYNLPMYILEGQQLDFPRERPDDDNQIMMMMEQRIENPVVRERIQERVQQRTGGRFSRQLGRVTISNSIARNLVGKPCSEVVDRLIDRTHAVPLAPDQKAILFGVLSGGQGGQSVFDEKKFRDNLNATLRLLLSTAEYQLC